MFNSGKWRDAGLMFHRGLKTPETCLAAVKENGFALEYVSVDLKT